MSAKMDVYDQLWDNNKTIAEKTLHLPFLEDMQKKDLQADKYFIFMIQDINYHLKVADMLKEMMKMNPPMDIKQLMMNRHDVYKKYADDTLKKFNLKVGPEISTTHAMEKCLSDLGAIIKKYKEEPIYFVVALLASEMLWLWLARKLNEGNSNPYFTWKKENMQGNPEKHYKALINIYLTTYEQIGTAQGIFCQQMQNEHDFFASSLVEK